jgi:hypothetical protein
LRKYRRLENMHIDELRNVYSSPDINVIKSKKSVVGGACRTHRGDNVIWKVWLDLGIDG